MAKSQKLNLVEVLEEAEALTCDPGFLSTNHPGWKILAGSLESRYTVVDTKHIFDVNFDADVLHDDPTKAIITVRCGDYLNSDTARIEYTIPYAALVLQMKIVEAEMKIVRVKKKLAKLTDGWSKMTV